MVVSSVSPLRWLTTAVQPLPMARSIASSVSVSVPIWLSLMRMLLAHFSARPRWRNLMLVTNRSSPTIWILSPSLAVSFVQPSQSSSARPSSMLRMGYLAHQAVQMSISSSLVAMRSGADLKKQ